MKKILIVVDYQNDFISGSLGFDGADGICDRIAEKIARYRESGGEVLFTYDTHGADYLSTAEGRALPVPHCIRGTEGWELHPRIEAMRREGDRCILKPSFGSAELLDTLRAGAYDAVELVGLVTNICVISNAILAKAALPEAEITVDAACVGSGDKKLEEEALDVMEGLQIGVKNR